MFFLQVVGLQTKMFFQLNRINIIFNVFFIADSDTVGKLKIA